MTTDDRYDENGNPVLSRQDKREKQKEYSEMKSRSRLALAQLKLIGANESLGKIYDLSDKYGAITAWCEMDIYTGEFISGTSEENMNKLLEDL
jgi:hypothetical protein